MNEWNVTNGSQKDYQDFERVQLEVYNAASFGWSYWTLKNDRKHWDFEWNIRNDFLQLGKSLGFPFHSFENNTHTCSLADLFYFSSYFFFFLLIHKHVDLGYIPFTGRSPDVKRSNFVVLLGTTCICFFLHGIL